MEDIKLGRELAPQATFFNTTQATWVRCLDADGHRTRIIFSGDGSNSYFMFPGNPGVAITTGFLVTNANPVLELRIEDWGRLIESPWFVFTQALNGTLTIMTASLMRD